MSNETSEMSSEMSNEMSNEMSKNCLFVGIFLIVCFLIYILWSKISILIDTFSASPVQSKIDGQKYKVQENLDCPTCASDILAQIHEKNKILINHLQTEFPEDPRTHRLIQNYKRSNIYEGTPDGGKNTSYSINKGEKLVFCLRSDRDKASFHRLNLIMYVDIHELSHLASATYGHNTEFRRNFSWLLREAVKIGIWNYENYGMANEEYCGISINRTHGF